MKIVIPLVSLFFACRAENYVVPFSPWDFPHGFGRLGHFKPPLQHVHIPPSPFFKIHIFGLGGVNYIQRDAFRDNGVRRFGFSPFDEPRYRDEGTLGLKFDQLDDDDDGNRFDDFDRRRPGEYMYDDLRRDTEDMRRRGFGNRGAQIGFRGNGNSQVIDTRQEGRRGLENSRGSGYEKEILGFYDDDYQDVDRYGKERNVGFIGLGDVRQRKLDRLAENNEIKFRDLREMETLRNDRSLGFNNVPNNQYDKEGQYISRMDNDFGSNKKIMSRRFINSKNDLSKPLTSIRQGLNKDTTNYVSDLSKGMTDMILTSEQDSARNDDYFDQRMDLNGQNIFKE